VVYPGEGALDGLITKGKFCMSRHGWLSLRRSRRLGRAVSQRIDVEAVHRRGWGSLYAALSRGCIDAEALRVLLSHHPLTGGQPPIYAVDVSVWSRCDAEASPLLKATTTPRTTPRDNPSPLAGPTSSSRS